ncbi:MAG: C_GCAxxG_C_C family protein [Bacteroidetes bacterium]|nr:C_GCAxxG_C_C family protein [Bacteroidota bacterium]
MGKTEKAIAYFKNSFNCSQSVLAALAPETGISEEMSMKVACAFGGGMGRTQMTCGAVTGALMALGLKYGKGLNDPDSHKLLTYEKTVKFMEAFKNKHQSIICRDLLDGLDMVADSELIKERNLYEKKCALYVEDAVSIAGELMKS